MATEQGIYAQVVKLFRKDFKFVVTDKNENEAKFKFRGLSARSKRWFDLDLDWIEVFLALVTLISMRNFFKATRIHRILIRSDSFKLQLEMENVWNHLSLKMMPQSSSIVRTH